MPVSFLSPTQRERYGRYPDVPSADDLARYFYLGTFLERPVDDVPLQVQAALSTQLQIADVACLQGYETGRQHHRHAVEIRERYGYREFADPPIGFRLARWLCALCWTGTERPSVLFERATAWLLTHKVLLPGVTTLERFIAQVRARMEARLWRLLSQGITIEQQARLEGLLTVAEGSRQSWLDKLRKGPVRVSGPALVQALGEGAHAVGRSAGHRAGNRRTHRLRRDLHARGRTPGAGLGSDDKPVCRAAFPGV
jgi:hypothetical protein